MKKLGISLLLFISFTSVIYVCFLMLWALFVPYGYQKNMLSMHDHMTKRLKEANTTKDKDVLFLGSSHTFRGFDTRIFEKAGLSSFNLGSTAQTPIQTDYLLNKYLDSLRPKLVIYEVYPVTFSIDGVEASMNLMANESLNRGLVDMALKQNSIKVYNTMVLAFCEQLLNLKLMKEDKRKKQRYVKGGYVEEELRYFDRTPRPKEELKFDEAQFAWFEKNLQQLKKRNIDYILVQAPYPKTTYNAFTNLDGFDKRMKQYGRYYNFNEYMDLDDSLNYLDDSHLNQNGVNAFNKQLIDTLKTRKHLLSIKL